MLFISSLVGTSLMALAAFSPQTALKEGWSKPSFSESVMYSPKKMCDAPTTRIDVKPRTEKVKYDYSQSYAEIQKRDTDTINPYGYSNVTHTNGYMQGRISLSAETKLGFKALPRNDNNCVWYETVTINISIEPTIVIAKEVAEDPCMGRAVRTHELKHVMVDRKIVNKYAKIIGKKVYDGLKQRGFVAARIRGVHVDATAKRMRETVGQLVELEYKKMEIERAEEQQKVDSLEEYEHVSGKCPDFKPPVIGEATQSNARRR